MLRVKSMWYGENDKVSVVKKRKRIHGRLGSKLAQLPFPGNGARKLVGYFKRKQKIRKHTDTDVAFTREYSRVSIFHRERECTN